MFSCFFVGPSNIFPCFLCFLFLPPSQDPAASGSCFVSKDVNVVKYLQEIVYLLQIDASLKQIHNNLLRLIVLYQIYQLVS